MESAQDLGKTLDEGVRHESRVSVEEVVAKVLDHAVPQIFGIVTSLEPFRYFVTASSLEAADSAQKAFEQQAHPLHQ